MRELSNEPKAAGVADQVINPHPAASLMCVKEYGQATTPVNRRQSGKTVLRGGEHEDAETGKMVYEERYPAEAEAETDLAVNENEWAPVL